MKDRNLFNVLLELLASLLFGFVFLISGRHVWAGELDLFPMLTDIGSSTTSQGTDKLLPISGDLRYFRRIPSIMGKTGEESFPDGSGALERLESPFPAVFDKTSEYMIGSVAVGIVLPESMGTGLNNTENWTLDREQMVINEIRDGLQWWLNRDTEAGKKANLSFIYYDDIQYRVPTTHEPISTWVDDHDGDGFYDEGLWIMEVMENLSKSAPEGRGLDFSVIPPPGYCPTNQADEAYAACPYAYAVRSYNNYLRDKYDTDWAFTIFVVDSLNDNDGKFPDFIPPYGIPYYFAYAYAGGPFMVMTYDNNGYTIHNMDAVLAHEFGHIFYALDQYGECNKNEKSGFLNVINANCNTLEPSIMKGQLAPFNSGALDYYAKGQIGWWDSDNDGIYDPVDTIPSLELLGYVEGQPIFGTARDTQNRIINVQFRINSGPWQNALPVDGSFNASSEDFEITWPFCGPSLEVKAINTVYNESQPKGLMIPGSIGDNDGNSSLDLQDAVNGLKVAAGIQGTAVFSACGDVDGNNRIDLKEVIYLLQKQRGIR